MSESGGNPLFIYQLVQYLQGGTRLGARARASRSLWRTCSVSGPAPFRRGAAALEGRGGLGPAPGSGRGPPGRRSRLERAGGSAVLRAERLVRGTGLAGMRRDRHLSRPGSRDRGGSFGRRGASALPSGPGRDPRSVGSGRLRSPGCPFLRGGPDRQGGAHYAWRPTQPLRPSPSIGRPRCIASPWSCSRWMPPCVASS